MSCRELVEAASAMVHPNARFLAVLFATISMRFVKGFLIECDWTKMDNGSMSDALRTPLVVNIAVILV